MWDHAGTVAVAAVALVLIGFSQTAGDARAFAAKHRYQIDIDQESVAQALANIGAGLFQGMPVSTSLSASSLNDHSGARTGLASLTSGVTVLLTLLVLAPLFSDLPKPVLAALIIEAVVMGMMDLPEMRRLARVQRFDFWIAVAAIVGTLVFGVLAGVVIGIGALAALARLGGHPTPRCRSSAARPGTQVFRDARASTPTTSRSPGSSSSGWTAACSSPPPTRWRTGCAQVIHATPDLTGIVLDCGGINFVDSQGSAKMGDVVDLAEESGITLRLARLKPASGPRWIATASSNASAPTTSTATSTGRCRHSSRLPPRLQKGQ